MIYCLHVTDKTSEAKAPSRAVKCCDFKEVTCKTSRKILGGLNRNPNGQKALSGDFVKGMLDGVALPTTSADKCSALWQLSPLHATPEVLSLNTVVGATSL